MGNKYYVFHGLLSQMSRFVQQGHRHEDLGLGVAVTSIHQLPRRGLLGNWASGIRRSQKPRIFFIMRVGRAILLKREVA
jgi:hypothetical protein